MKKLSPRSYFTGLTSEFIEGVSMINGCKITLPAYNKMLLESKYYYSKPLKFIHYTSLNNCLNILRERSFSMYNLNCLYDKFELLFASKKIFPQLDEKAQEYWKSNIFSLSMCEYQLEAKETSFDVWRNYAQDGLGVRANAFKI